MQLFKLNNVESPTKSHISSSGQSPPTNSSVQQAQNHLLRIKQRDSQIEFEDQTNNNSPKMIDLSFGSSSIQPTKQNSQSNFIQLMQKPIGPPAVNQELLSKTQIQEQQNSVKPVISTAKSAMDHSKQMGPKLKQKPVQLTANLPQLNMTLQVGNNSQITNTQSNIQLNTLYKTNPKGGRALRGNQVQQNRGNEIFTEKLDFTLTQQRFGDQSNNFTQIKSKSIGPRRQLSINANQSNLKTPSFQQRANLAQQIPQGGQTLSDFDSSGYINFVLKKDTSSLAKASNSSDKKFSHQELQNKANFQRNFNKVYMNTQKQNQRKKLLYEFCLAKEHMAIEKPIPISHAPDVTFKSQKSQNIQQKHKLFMQFILEKINLENLDVQSQQQVSLVQAKFQQFEKEQLNQQHENGKTIDQIEKGLAIQNQPLQVEHIQLKTQHQPPQFNIESMFQGGSKKLQALSDHQRYDLLKQLISVSSNKSSPFPLDPHQKELSKIKFHLSKLSMELLVKKSQDKTVTTNAFRQILAKAQQAQKLEKLIKSQYHQTVDQQTHPNLLTPLKDFKLRKVTEQVQILKSQHQKYLSLFIQDQDSFNRIKYEDLKDDDYNMRSRSNSQVSSNSSEYSQTYHKVSNRQSPRVANSDLSTQIDTLQMKKQNIVEATQGNISSQNQSRVSDLGQFTTQEPPSDKLADNQEKASKNQRKRNSELDDYSEYPELDKNKRKDTEENDYLHYKNQIKKLKEDSKPSYQRNKKRPQKDSRNSKMSEKYKEKIKNVSKIQNNEFTTVETLEMHRKNQVSKINGNGLAIQMAKSGLNEPKSELKVFQNDKDPFQKQDKSQKTQNTTKTQNTPLRNTAQQDFFGSRNFGYSEYNHSGQVHFQRSNQNELDLSESSCPSPFKAKHYNRIKKSSIVLNDNGEYQHDKQPTQIKSSDLFQSKQPMVTFTTMTDAVKNATNGRKDNLPNLNTSRQHQYGITLQERVNANFSYPSNSNSTKRNKHDLLNMTARGKSHIGFGSGYTSRFGERLNTNYKDMDSLMGDLSKGKQNDENPDAAFGVSSAMNTLNVQKMVLMKPTPTRYEQNRAQFESLLRQTLQSQIEQMKKKKEKIQEMCYNDIIENHKFNNKYTNNPMSITNQFKNNKFSDYNGIFKKSKQHSFIDDASSSSSLGKSVIHLVSLDGPNPNGQDYYDDNSDNKKQLQKFQSNTNQENEDTKDNALIEQENEKQKFLKEIKDRAINNILEVKKLPPKYFPPKKLHNPFEDAMLDQQKLLQNRKDAQAKYSEISKNRYKQDEGAPFKFVVRVINESGRTEAVYDRDQDILFPGWEKADDQIDSLYNFKWKPTSHGINYEMISKHGLRQLVNHVRGHHEITTKDRLFLNMKTYYEALKRESIYEVVPLTIVLDYMNDGVGDQVQMFQGIHKIIDKVSKQGNSLSHDVEVINQKIQKYQAQNCRNVKTIYKITECCHKKQNLWLLKPTGFNRGIGIHIFQTYEQLCEIMSQTYGIGKGAKDKVSIQQPHKCNLQQKQINQDKFESTNFVIQKLIERPLLFKQRKFDIRVWVILNSFDGKCYMYKESYVRTSSKTYQEYDPKKPNDEQIFMQLTNNAIQSQGKEYGKYEEGNIISTYSMMNYVSSLEQANDKTTEALIDELKASMIMLIQNSIRSVKGKLLSQKYTFELLGYDFILDEYLNTYLIEVNTNPCLEESNHLLRCMLPRMIDDMLNIVSDPIFNQAHLFSQLSSPPVSPRRQINSNYRSIYKLPGKLFGEGHPGYADNENLFENVCNIDQ